MAWSHRYPPQHPSLSQFFRCWQHDLADGFQPTASLSAPALARDDRHGTDLPVAPGPYSLQPSSWPGDSGRNGMAADVAKLHPYSADVSSKPALVAGAAAHRALLYGCNVSFRVEILFRAGRRVERKSSGPGPRAALIIVFADYAVSPEWCFFCSSDAFEGSSSLPGLVTLMPTAAKMRSLGTISSSEASFSTRASASAEGGAGTGSRCVIVQIQPSREKR